MEKMVRTGFIGTGNMGGALALAASRADEAYKIMLANRGIKKAEELKDRIENDSLKNPDTKVIVSDNDGIAAEADVIFLGVKPQMMEEMLKGISGALKERAAASDSPVLVTMAAGLSMNRIKELAGGDYPIIRIMPNTPASIGEGVILYAAGSGLKPEMKDAFLKMLSKAGLLCSMPEKLIDAGSAVSGCGPAFVYMFIEALADGGVLCGLPRADAVKLAAQMVKGSADMVLETGKHPGELKDAVCSPGGTTIEGVRTLEECGMRGAVMDAVISAYEKNSALK